MGWSTRQLAELAGTTVKTIRHYHQVGLLDEPERASNGYKQYGSAHLVRLLQILRMKDLGIPLAQIRTMARADQDPEAAIRLLDADLAATIERLQRIRAELAVILELRAPIDTPAPFHSIQHTMSERDKGIATVLSRVFNDDALEDFRQMMSEPSAADEPFDRLDEDADDARIESVAQLLATQMAEHRERFTWLEDIYSAVPRGQRFAEMALGTAMPELLNPAQLAACVRALEIVEEAGSLGPTPDTQG
ncbi:helix-turn-helix domain-containing protein [Nocardia sp. NPDC055321]